MKKYDCIAFDLDGTLSDPEHGLIEGFIYAFKKMGVTDYGTRESLRRFIGPSLYVVWQDEFGFTPETVIEAIEKFREYYNIYGWWDNKVYDGIPEMLADLKASRKTVNLYKLIVNVFDYVYLAENHSKVILIHNDKWCVSICTSQNQTRGNRTESGMISTSPEIYFNLQGQFSDIVNNHAILLNGLFNPTTSESK